MILNQVHRKLSCILDYFPADTVTDECFLEQYIATVFLIGQDTPYGCDAPSFFTINIGDPLSFQRVLYHAEAVTQKILTEDLFYNLRLLRDDHGLPIRAFLKGVQVGVLYRYPPLPHGLPLAPSDIG